MQFEATNKPRRTLDDASSYIQNIISIDSKKINKRLIQKLIQQKRADLSISPELRPTLYSATYAQYVFSTAEKEAILSLVDEYLKKLFLWLIK